MTRNPIIISKINNFQDWKISEGYGGNNTEDMLVLYFDHLINIKKIAKSRLWPIWSHIRHQCEIHEGVDVKQFRKLKMLCRQEGHGEVRKAEVFTKDQVFPFLSTTPDVQYFIHKVIYMTQLLSLYNKLSNCNDDLCRLH